MCRAEKGLFGHNYKAFANRWLLIAFFHQQGF